MGQGSHRDGLHRARGRFPGPSWATVRAVRLVRSFHPREAAMRGSGWKDSSGGRAETWEARSGPWVLWAVNPAGDPGWQASPLGFQGTPPTHVVPSDEAGAGPAGLSLSRPGRLGVVHWTKGLSPACHSPKQDGVLGVCPPPPQLPSAAVGRVTAPGAEDYENGTEPARGRDPRSPCRCWQVALTVRCPCSEGPAEAPDVRCRVGCPRTLSRETRPASAWGDAQFLKALGVGSDADRTRGSCSGRAWQLQMHFT